ncbi:MAG: discoidin domain-containing protein [Bacteroidales bacterium]|nr:discoidin domain-containing protein [Bacteroidales bacterium]
MKNSGISLLLAVALAAASCADNGVYNRGLGIYPGNPEENPAPELKVDNSTGNIALRRAVYQSSAVDYNYTGQLVTDGIVSEGPLPFFRISDQDGLIDKKFREMIFDFAPYSKYLIQGKSDAFVQVDLVNIDQPVSEIRLQGYVGNGDAYTCEFQGSFDGQTWTTLHNCSGKGEMAAAFKSAKTLDYSSYRAVFHSGKPVDWDIRNWLFYKGGEPVQMLTHEYFKSVWVSAGCEDEWIYVDFGASASAEKVCLKWVNKAVSGNIEVSEDAKNWKKVASLPGGEALTDEIDLPRGTKGRYLKVSMDKAANSERLALSELEVLGKGALKPVAKPQPAAVGNELNLTRGQWKLERSSEVSADGAALSRQGFDDKTWLPATVPGTILKSFIEAGAVANPDYSDNQLTISDSYFLSDFWYRNEFKLPQNFVQDRVFLNFGGINWKADIWLNGQSVGRIEGAFKDMSFDVTDLVKAGQSNYLAVLIHRNDHPGAATEQDFDSPNGNGGNLGLDNPTFHASVGWDWIATIRGRNTGIWNDVRLTTTGPVTVSEPFVQTKLNLPDNTVATLEMEAVLTNRSDKAIKAVWTWEMDGKVLCGDGEKLQPGESRTVYGTATIQDPELWWPAGYGDQVLHDTRISVKDFDTPSDEVSFKTGLRQMTYDDSDGILYMYINGRRFIGRGGNWGFSENNLGYRAREYDIALAFHADMHFTMVRNWVGMIGDKEFYEACDRHGIMVWQDFWLANPADGPEPADETMFMDNAASMLCRIRNHACIGLYCGRNEGVPPTSIDNALRKLVPQLHPGIVYIPDSADKTVSGRGPYGVQSAQTYFSLPHGETFHSERGLPNVMTYESASLCLPEERNWPINDLWGMHDYCQGGAMRCRDFTAFVDKALGEPASAREFCSRAQLINYDGYRAIFESRSSHRQGLLLWMSHPAWPSMVWQTYDYYFEPTAGYFGCKKANEPLHIQWNPVSREVEVVNYSAGDHEALSAIAAIYSLEGEKLLEKYSIVPSKEDSTVGCIGIDSDAIGSEVCFLVLKLNEGDKPVSDNFYILGREEGNVQAIMSLPEAKVAKNCKLQDLGESWQLEVKLSNKSKTPALMQRLITVGSKSGERILPAFYSDNYLNLLGGESKTVTITVRKADCRGEKPEVILKGLE